MPTLREVVKGLEKRCLLNAGGEHDYSLGDKCTKCGFVRVNKYGNRRIWCDVEGRMFHSVLERDTCRVIRLLERAGKCKLLEFQPAIFLTQAGIEYRADFLTRDNDTGREVWHDAKGRETADFILKRKLFQHYAGRILTLWARPEGGGLPTIERVFMPATPKQLERARRPKAGL